jgi:ABC-2 type transport system ATP-binding protein
MNDVVLETSGLTKYYGRTLAVDHFDLKVPRGCVCGFVGRNGAGKTTVIKLVLGLLQPTAGSSRLLGCDSTELTPAIRQRIGYVTEGHRLFRWMSIGELERFQRAFFPKQWEGKLFGDMMEYFGLPKKRKIKDLSSGERAQVSLALVLASNPEVLIMDDPTLGLDAATRRQFLEGAIRFIMREGRTVLFSSHILADVERVADRIVVIDKGVLKANCSLEQFRAAVKKVVFSFRDSVPAEVNIGGLLHYGRSQRELEVTLVGAGDDEISEWARLAGAERHQIVKMSLEDQFIEFTAPLGMKKTFQWEEV